MSIAVPISLPLPPGVSISWTETGAACVVWCAYCRLGTALYSTVLWRKPDALQETIDEHRKCLPPDVP